MMMNIKEALKISKAVRSENGNAEVWLKHKCRWEQQSRTAIIMGYGDPRTMLQDNRIKELEEENNRLKDYVKHKQDCKKILPTESGLHLWTG